MYELITCLDHLVVLPQADSLVCATACKDLLLGMHCTAPELCLGDSGEVAVDECLNLLAAGLIDFDDLSAPGAHEDRLRLLEVVECAHACRELRHRSQIDDLLLCKLPIPEDQLAVIATSDDGGPVHDIDDLPERICVSLD